MVGNVCCGQMRSISHMVTLATVPQSTHNNCVAYGNTKLNSFCAGTHTHTLCVRTAVERWVEKRFDANEDGASFRVFTHISCEWSTYRVANRMGIITGKKCAFSVECNEGEMCLQFSSSSFVFNDLRYEWTKENCKTRSWSNNSTNSEFICGTNNVKRPCRDRYTILDGMVYGVDVHRHMNLCRFDLFGVARSQCDVSIRRKTWCWTPPRNWPIISVRCVLALSNNHLQWNNNWSDIGLKCNFGVFLTHFTRHSIDKRLHKIHRFLIFSLSLFAQISHDVYTIATCTTRGHVHSAIHGWWFRLSWQSGMENEKRVNVRRIRRTFFMWSVKLPLANEENNRKVTERIMTIVSWL